MAGGVAETVWGSFETTGGGLEATGGGLETAGGGLSTAKGALGVAALGLRAVGMDLCTGNAFLRPLAVGLRTAVGFAADNRDRADIALASICTWPRTSCVSGSLQASTHDIVSALLVVIAALPINKSQYIAVKAAVLNMSGAVECRPIYLTADSRSLLDFLDYAGYGSTCRPV